jgi:hypothetical protein
MPEIVRIQPLARMSNSRGFSRCWHEWISNDKRVCGDRRATDEKPTSRDLSSVPRKRRQPFIPRLGNVESSASGGMLGTCSRSRSRDHVWARGAEGVDQSGQKWKISGDFRSIDRDIRTTRVVPGLHELEAGRDSWFSSDHPVYVELGERQECLKGR